MSRFSTNEDIGELLELVDMEAFLDREGIDYRVTHGSSGTQLQVKECPICGSSKWKVYLNADSGAGNCFAGDHPVDENFSKWNFIQSSLNLTGTETFNYVKAMALESGWQPKRTKSAEVVENTTELVLPESAAITSHETNIPYLVERGVDPELAMYFHLRYSSEGVFWYRDAKGEVQFQDYKKRIILPIYDIDGNLASFQGRDITNTSSRKYLFPPGFASTGRLLYNAMNVKGLAHIAMCEGAFDVMATKKALDEEVALREIGVVGSFGKHLSWKDLNGGDQLSQLIKLKALGLKMVTIIWDGEVSAFKAALATAQVIMKVGLEVRVAILPDGKDPNEIPPSKLREVFWKAIPINKVTLAKLKVL